MNTRTFASWVWEVALTVGCLSAVIGYWKVGAIAAAVSLIGLIVWSNAKK